LEKKAKQQHATIKLKQDQLLKEIRKARAKQQAMQKIYDKIVSPLELRTIPVPKIGTRR
jgi:vacuolar-type H+-ATPase subunit D/Vma8